LTEQRLLVRVTSQAGDKNSFRDKKFVQAVIRDFGVTGAIRAAQSPREGWQ
jgi:hypothetical protein